jgi:hypothetical protein
MPTVFAWATTDKLVEIDIPLNIVKHVGIGDSHIIKLCRENKIKRIRLLNYLVFKYFRYGHS